MGPEVGGCLGGSSQLAISKPEFEVTPKPAFLVLSANFFLKTVSSRTNSCRPCPAGRGFCFILWKNVLAGENPRGVCVP